MSRDSRIRTFKKLGKKVLYGSCVAGLAAGTFLGSYTISKKIFEPKAEFNFGDLPLMENNYGLKIYSKNTNRNVVITSQFEEELFKQAEEDNDVKYVINALKYAVEQYNSLSKYFKTTLTAETNTFEEYGISKYNATKDDVKITIGDDPKSNSELATTYLTSSANGKIEKSNIQFKNEAVFGIWNSYSNLDEMFAPQNLVISSVAMHEFEHAFKGFKDVYTYNKDKETLMYGYATPLIKEYTEYDKELNSLYDQIIFENYKINAKTDEKIEQYNNIFNNDYVLTKVFHDDEIEK